MTTITPKTVEVNIQFTSTGYPINPATGQMYSRNEIVANPAIPLPTFVDAANPPLYWQRRTAAEMTNEAKRIADKNRRNKAARERRQNQTSKHIMDNRVGWATMALVERVNSKTIETFATETNSGQPDPDETDGPRNMAESIMELMGQDYKAARKSGSRPVSQLTNTQAQAALDLALKPGAGGPVQKHRWSW